MKQHPNPKTLDAARQIIQQLTADLAAEKKSKQSAAVAVPTVAEPKSTSPNAPTEPLTLPAITEESLLEAIRGETDYKKRWAMQRTLATLQNARAVESVKANKRTRR